MSPKMVFFLLLSLLFCCFPGILIGILIVILCRRGGGSKTQLGPGDPIDERDVSMHGGFKEELKEILGAGHDFGRLPRVFADGKYLGGADDVRQMHEAREMGTALEGCEMVTVGKAGGVVEACGGCGGVRFVPCETCSGSCKVYVEEEEEEDERGCHARLARRAWRLYEEPIGQKMDLLWEAFEVNDTKDANGKERKKDEQEEEEEEEEEGRVRQFCCCLPALRRRAGQVASATSSSATASLASPSSSSTTPPSSGSSTLWPLSGSIAAPATRSARMSSSWTSSSTLPKMSACFTPRGSSRMPSGATRSWSRCSTAYPRKWCWSRRAAWTMCIAR